MASSGRPSLKSSNQSFFMIPDLNFPYQFHLTSPNFIACSLIDYLKIGKKVNRCSQTAVTKQLEVNAGSMMGKKKEEIRCFLIHMHE